MGKCLPRPANFRCRGKAERDGPASPSCFTTLKNFVVGRVEASVLGFRAWNSADGSRCFGDGHQHLGGRYTDRGKARNYLDAPGARAVPHISAIIGYAFVRQLP